MRSHAATARWRPSLRIKVPAWNLERSHRSQRGTGGPTLKALGLTKNDSSRWQRIASLPEEKFEGYLSERIDDATKEITSADLLRLAHKQESDHLKVAGARSQGPRGPCLVP